MSSNAERATTRLHHLKAIEPLLGALRTISMGAWQLSLNKIADMRHAEQRYQLVLDEILPVMKNLPPRQKKTTAREQHQADAILLLIGTERGLCGKFNENLVQETLAWIGEQQFSSHQIWAMGSRLSLTLSREGINPAWQSTLPAGEPVHFKEAYFLTQKWLQQFEAYAFNRLFALYYQASPGGTLTFKSTPLVPYDLTEQQGSVEPQVDRWPPAIIETDPEGIYQQIVHHYVAYTFYQILLKSAVAEHSSRFRMMEEAQKNAEDIVEELNQIIQTERKRKITQDMQELAVGSGLIDNPSGNA